MLSHQLYSWENINYSRKKFKNSKKSLNILDWKNTSHSLKSQRHYFFVDFSSLHKIIQIFMQNIETFLSVLIWNEKCLWQFTLCPLSTKQLWSTNKKTLNYLRGKTNLVFLASYDIYSRKVVSNEFLNKTGKRKGRKN